MIPGRILPLLLLALGASAGTMLPTGQLYGQTPAPNIVFVFVDDQRHDSLGCAGHTILQTPNIDRLAAEGVRFSNAMVTTSICWISRSTVLTGMWSRSHGSKNNVNVVSDTAASTTYPQQLREQGYRTGFFGKWDANMPTSFDHNRAFDLYEEINRTPYFKEQEDGTQRHTAELIGDRAVEFINTQSTNQPFCLNLWFNVSHAEDGDKRPGSGHFPWPKAVDHLYRETTIPPPRLADPEIFENHPEFLKKSLNRTRFYWRWDTPEKYDSNMRAYFRMLSGMDGVVGRVVQALHKRALAKNTVIVYSSDNGYYLGDRGFAGKWSHYEPSIRVPLIVYDPRLQPSHRGRVLDQFVLNVDLPATFLELAGLPIPHRYQGQSLVPLIYGNETDWRSDVFLEHLPPFGERIPQWEGVKNARYKYARYLQPDYEFLHDLQRDPDELQNVSADPQYAHVLEQLRQRTNVLRAQYEAAGDGWRP